MRSSDLDSILTMSPIKRVTVLKKLYRDDPQMLKKYLDYISENQQRIWQMNSYDFRTMKSRIPFV